MKILAINCHPDLSYYAQHGVQLEVEYKTLTLPIFPLKFLYVGKDQNGLPFNLYTPDVSAYLEANYKTFQYSVILVGWNPADYGDNVKRTGGYTCPQQLSCNTFWATVRQDTPPNNLYPVHELMHCLCLIINILFSDHVPKDFMDSTLVNNVWQPYYINDPNSTDPQSNFNQTWLGITPFIPQLNAIIYASTNPITPPTAILTRNNDNGVETLGTLQVGALFQSRTLELSWKNNQKNISSIPTGIYNCKWAFKWNSLAYHYQLQNVLNRTGIFIHNGNYFFNSAGCIILGSLPQDINKDGQLDLINSNSILAGFEKLMGKKDFYLKII
jgi:hypothetical protein